MTPRTFPAREAGSAAARRWRPAVGMLVGLLLAPPAGLAAEARPAAKQARAGWRAFFPVSENSRWVYRFTNHTSGTHSTITTRAGASRPIERLERKAPTVFEESGADGRNPVVYFEDDAGYLVEFLDAVYGPADVLQLPPHFGTGIQILPPRLALGVRWEQHGVLVGRVLWTHRVAAAETVTVPAGVFPDCYRVDAAIRPDGGGDVAAAMDQYGMFRYRYSDWYAPGIGLVKSVTTENGELVISKELQSYTLGAAPGEPRGESENRRAAP